MTVDKYTQRVQEALHNCQTIAARYHHQTVEPEHLLEGAAGRPEGVAPGLLGSRGVARRILKRRLEA